MQVQTSNSPSGSRVTNECVYYSKEVGKHLSVSCHSFSKLEPRIKLRESSQRMRLHERADVTTAEQKAAILRRRGVPEQRPSALCEQVSVKDRRALFVNNKVGASNANPLSPTSKRPTFKKAGPIAGGRFMSKHVGSAHPTNNPEECTVQTLPHEKAQLPQKENSVIQPSQPTALSVISVPGAMNNLSFDQEDAANQQDVMVEGQDQHTEEVHVLAAYEDQLHEARRRYGRPKVRRSNSTHANTPFAEKLKAFQKSYPMEAH